MRTPYERGYQASRKVLDEGIERSIKHLKGLVATFASKKKDEWDEGYIQCIQDEIEEMNEESDTKRQDRWEAAE